jgi:sugar lactone lactonase YvrE
MPASDRRLLADGLKFAEAPRWHDGRLWVADMIGHQVVSVGLDGTATVVADFDDETSGLGFLPDGTMIVVVRSRKHLVRIDGGRTSLFCDLDDVPCESLNDMVVDDLGRIYVDAVVRRAEPGTDDIGESVVFVDDTGSIRGVTTGLVNPNGLAITADRRELIVAETWRHKLTAFDIGTDGSLGERRAFADLGPAAPDGICLDAEGAVWVGSPNEATFLRVAADGSVVERVPSGGGWAVACALGGDDGCTLFLVIADTSSQTLRQPGGTRSRIEMMRVEVPGAGWP